MTRAIFVWFLVSGCGSLVSTGNLGERPVLLDGTGVAWLDETTYVVDGESIRLEDRSAEGTTLHLLFSGAVFDASDSFAALPANERDLILDEIARRDKLEIEIRRGDRLAAGDELEFDNQVGGVPRASPFIDNVRLTLGDDLLDNSGEYPERVGVLAGGRQVRVTLTQVETRIAGTLKMDVERTSVEEDANRERIEGSIEILFDIDLLPERVGECNFDPSGAGIIDPCAALTF